VIAVVAVVILGRLALRPLFRSVARTHSPELFVAACLLVVIAAGLATALAGLSMALGALIGGLLLAGTEYRRQVEVTIEPFKGLFVGVFFSVLIRCWCWAHRPVWCC
jgi:CPA2 family monovalent cation:H+ antiporter-2